MVLKLEVGGVYEEVGTGKLVEIISYAPVGRDDSSPFLSHESTCYSVTGERYYNYGPRLKEVSIKVGGTTSPVDHPTHYTSSPASCKCGLGIECIQITEHMGFNLGNAMKYIWRCDLKKDAIEDLKKSIWYIQREIAKRENAQ